MSSSASVSLRGDRRVVIFWGAILAAYLFAAVYFSSLQTIWVDETTQLAGLRMPIGDVLLWLAGRYPENVGVPPDRAPPLSYLIGKLWAEIFGATPKSLRFMGIVLVALSAPALYQVGRLYAGQIGGFFVLCIVLLSPNVVVQAVSIRSYPLFFLAGCWALLYYVRLALGATEKYDFLKLGLALSVAVISHFYGVFLSFVLIVSLTILYVARKKNCLPMIIIICPVLLSIVLIVPYIVAAFSIPGATPGEDSLRQSLGYKIFRLLFRLIAHPSARTLGEIFVGLSVIFWVLALVLAIFRLRLGGRGVELAIPMVLGLVILSCVELVSNNFDALAPHYNIWMLPLLPMLITAGFDFHAGWRSIANILSLALVAIGICGLLAFSRYAPLYTNGPGDWIKQFLNFPKDTLIIYKTSDPRGHLYFPAFFQSEGKVTQWLARGDGSIQKVIPGGFEDVISSDLKHFKHVIDAKVFQLGADQLSEIARGRLRCDDLHPTPVKEGRTEVYCSFIGARLTWRP